ncbi:DnaJ-domain-containing protein [Xylona heveae TC161]|uniref:DnaJ-domain-containing protein n=1 Tax=Xylona heveae (strain CBS 132557 / TC161) TaxID=1328760 RepID=A0A165J3R1_XYLHT|nr:DnaJ-domain-containing protein [Xylona heveae TC161]KZF25689.1 DnaJ-domain-containing protein [Xylona heveae TC161]
MPLRLSSILLHPCTEKLSAFCCCQRAALHSSFPRHSEHLNHYEILGLELSASQAEVKKQFYSLSKTHHPDRNPKDPGASSRFVKISEAYAILGSPHKRKTYDQHLQQTSSTLRDRRAAYGGTTGPAGARPATGLSRRRTPFRGPPPSFYRSGGWDAHQESRGAQADFSASGNSSRRSDGGFGPGGPTSGLDDDVPHFDRERHLRSQEQQEVRRRRREASKSHIREPGGSVLINFILVGGVLSLAIFLPGLFERKFQKKKKDDQS